MKIVVFGASGATGRCLVMRARERGHEVTAVVREGSACDGARTLRADVLDESSVVQACAGHDAIVSALGQRRASLWPYARMLSPPDVMQRATTNFIAAARAHHINKVFVVSLHGAGDSLARTAFFYRFLVTRTQIRHPLADSNNMESLLAASNLDWLAVRPVTLSNAKPSGRCRVREDRIGSFAKIARADVAAFIVAELDRDGRDQRTPSLT